MDFESADTRELTEKISSVESRISALNDELKLLRNQYMQSVWKDQSGLLKKCFRHDKPFSDGSVISTYAVINRLPISRNFRTGEPFQPEWLPSIQFQYSPTRFVPFNDNEESGDEDIIFFDTIHITDLPAPWGHPVSATPIPKWPLWQEVPKEEFIDCLHKRIKFVEEKIFE